MVRAVTTGQLASLGDAQVSGLPERADREAFCRALKERLDAASPSASA
jgi:hypothetical protein